MTITKYVTDWLVRADEDILMGRYPEDMSSFIKKCTLEFTEKYLTITKNLYQWLIKEISSL